MKNNSLWPVRLGVRTSGFHPGNRGSIPLRAAQKGLDSTESSPFVIL